ncbi:MAG: efflux RND transporter periplasmic adaptor subunit [Bacteroidota bacterium]
MKNKVVLIIILSVAVIGAGGFFYFSSGSSPDTMYRTEKVTRGDIQVVVTATGTLSADTTVDVGTQVSGTISKLYVDWNSKVKKGQVIALIDPTFLQSAVEDAQASLEKAKAQTDDAKRTYLREKDLLAKGLAAQADYDAAITTYESNVAAQKSAQSELDRAIINLKYATITAPIDGVVISRAVDIGQTVAASFATPTLFTIANDLTKMQVQAAVDEADIGGVRDGQEVLFTVDAYPDQTFHGTVTQIRLMPVTVQNVITYTVIIDVPNPELKLMPGMTATITILVTKKESVLKIPTIAFRFQPMPDQIAERKDSTGAPEDSAKAAQRRAQYAQMQGGGAPGLVSRAPTRLWVVDKDKKLSPIYIRTGISDGTYTEILHGKVEEGEEVVVGVMSQRPTAAAPPFGGGRRF